MKATILARVRTPRIQTLAALSLAGVGAATVAIQAPVLAADPAAVTSSAPAESKAATVRLDLELTRTDVVEAAPAAPASPATPIAAPTAIGPTTVTVATPKIVTLDGSTASISVTGGDLDYTLSLSPGIGKGGKLLILWNIRLGGKSLPGATGVSANGAVRIDLGKSSGIAEISLTDPTTGRKSTFRLQGTATTAPADESPAPAGPAGAPIPATTVP